MNRRADAAVETRRRIVEATASLHAEKGVAATTFRDIAARADVGVGTVYHHFPTYEHVITACGAFTFASARPPQIATLQIDDPDQRVRTLVGETFAFYERIPQFGAVRAERRHFPALDEAYRREEEHRRALVEEALRPFPASDAARLLAFSLIDFSVYESLVRGGLSRDAAADEIATAILQRLRSTQ
jgi:AcrR family transcriptional regulator